MDVLPLFQLSKAICSSEDGEELALTLIEQRVELKRRQLKAWCLVSDCPPPLILPSENDPTPRPPLPSPVGFSSSSASFTPPF